MFERKQLSTLQPTHPGNAKKSLDALKSKKPADENMSSLKRKDGIYVDPPGPPAKKFRSCEAQTDPMPPCSRCNEVKDLAVETSPEGDTTPAVPSVDTESIVNMMTSEQPTETYWALLAEERGKALGEALVENKVLFEDNCSLREEIKGMKDLVAEAKILAEMVESAMEIDPPGEEEDEAQFSTENLKEVESAEATDEAT